MARVPLIQEQEHPELARLIGDFAPVAAAD